MSEPTGTFVVTHVDEGSLLLRDVDTAQVHTVERPLAVDDPPDLAVGTVLQGTIAPQPPTNVVWELRSIEEARTVDLIDSDLSPTRQAETTADGQEPGTVTRIEREGDGELHVLTVPDGEEVATAREVLDDGDTIARAARLDATRVEVRTGDGLVSVRYLPD